MKLWKRMALSVTAVTIMTCGALIMPNLINTYNDKSFVNKVNYVDGEDIDLFKYEEEQSMTDKMKIIGNIYEEDMSPYIIEIPYVMNERQMQEIVKIATEELKKWFVDNEVGIYLTYFQFDFEEKISLKDCVMYSMYDKNLSYLRISLSINDAQNMGEYLVTMYMDNNTHKIYLVMIQGNAFENWQWNLGMVSQNLVTTIFNVTDRIRMYYDLQMSVSNESHLYDEYDEILRFLIGESIEWEIGLDYTEKDELALFIGIKDFENRFLGEGNSSMTYAE